MKNNTQLARNIEGVLKIKQGTKTIYTPVKKDQKNWLPKEHATLVCLQILYHFSEMIYNPQMHFILLNLHYHEGEILQELTSQYKWILMKETQLILVLSKNIECN